MATIEEVRNALIQAAPQSKAAIDGLSDDAVEKLYDEATLKAGMGDNFNRLEFATYVMDKLEELPQQNTPSQREEGLPTDTTPSLADALRGSVRDETQFEITPSIIDNMLKGEQLSQAQLTALQSDLQRVDIKLLRAWGAKGKIEIGNRLYPLNPIAVKVIQEAIQSKALTDDSATEFINKLAADEVASGKPVTDAQVHEAMKGVQDKFGTENINIDTFTRSAKGLIELQVAIATRDAQKLDAFMKANKFGDFPGMADFLKKHKIGNDRAKGERPLLERAAEEDFWTNAYTELKAPIANALLEAAPRLGQAASAYDESQQRIAQAKALTGTQVARLISKAGVPGPKNIKDYEASIQKALTDDPELKNVTAKTIMEGMEQYFRNRQAMLALIPAEQKAKADLLEAQIKSMTLGRVAEENADLQQLFTDYGLNDPQKPGAYEDAFQKKSFQDRLIGLGPLGKTVVSAINDVASTRQTQNNSKITERQNRAQDIDPKAILAHLGVKSWEEVGRFSTEQIADKLATFKDVNGKTDFVQQKEIMGYIQGVVGLDIQFQERHIKRNQASINDLETENKRLQLGIQNPILKNIAANGGGFPGTTMNRAVDALGEFFGNGGSRRSSAPIVVPPPAEEARPAATTNRKPPRAPAAGRGGQALDTGQ